MDEWMRWEEARVLLNVSRDKMSKLIKSAAIGSKKDPLDARVTLVKRDDVETLKYESKRRKKEKV